MQNDEGCVHTNRGDQDADGSPSWALQHFSFCEDDDDDLKKLTEFGQLVGDVIESMLTS